MDYYLLFLINEVELGTHHACFTLNIKIKYVIFDFESTSKFRKAVEDLKVGDGEKAGTTIGPIINSRCRWSHTIHIFSIQGTDDHIPYIFLVIILIGPIINSRHRWSYHTYFWWFIWWISTWWSKPPGNWREWRELLKKASLPEQKWRWRQFW